ncbi:RNA 2',3'-cyclic phosphodiesterase [Candidatus Woesearchaeota archaeon]|nr:RNA 2',3'-cyclic phosphodiesterase [Candidatus Woesearchaeota archaeon]
MRTFISIEIPREIKDKIVNTQNDLKKLDIDATYPFKKNIHVTLLFLGEKTDDRIKEIKERLFILKFNKFTVELKGLGAFPNLNRINVVWIGSNSNELIYLNDAICKQINQKNDKDFSVHLTITRIKSSKNIDKIRDFIKQNRDINFGSFEVKSFVLKKSTLTSSGPIYEDLETFYLS